MSTMSLVPPPLPIGNKNNASSPSGGGKASPSPTKAGEKGGKARGKGKAKEPQRAWADYTPTPSPWMEYTPTPWGGADAYGFGLAPSNDQPHLIPPPPHTQGLPLRPPPPVAHLAAAAAAAAAGAAAAAAAACDVTAAAAAGTSADEFGMETKNTFIHMADHDDTDAFGVPKAQTLPDVLKAKPTPQVALTEDPASPEEGDDEEDATPGEESVAPADLPSKGSELHGTGKCRPCAWFHKPQGCHNALECSYCHLCSESELKSRKKTKVAAMRMGALIPAKGPSKTEIAAQQGNAAPSRILKLSAVI